MSAYIKINGWSGDDKENVIKRLAKVFRMSEDDAGEVIDQIIAGQTWQSERPISENQLVKAEEFLVRLGFEVELISSTGDIFAPTAKTEPSSDTELAPPSILDAPGDYAKPYKRQSPLVKVGLAVVLLAVIAYGLMQTGILDKFFGDPRVLPTVQQPPPAFKPHPSAMATTGIQPLQGINFEGTPLSEFSYSQKGCGEPGAINKELRIIDLNTAQDRTFCSDYYAIPSPKGDWECEFKPEEKCDLNSVSQYKCRRSYQCLFETPEFNRTLFQKELGELTGAKTASPAQKPAEQTNEYSKILLGCKKEKASMEFLLKSTDWYQTQTDFCKGKTIASPLNEWDCKLKRESSMCKRGKDKEEYRCERKYHCIPETPGFNKASAKKKVVELENQENMKKAGVTNVTSFYGMTPDSTVRSWYTGGIMNRCTTKDELKGILLEEDLEQTQSTFSCKANTIPNPIESWMCELKSDDCPVGKKPYSCFRKYQCIIETPEYNRARFKKELEQGSN